MPAVPFHQPHVVGTELTYLGAALQSGQLHGDGEFSERAAALLRERTQSNGVLLTPSCTAALELAAMLVDIEPDDEVILPSFTFVSTANAFALRGARPVFVDVDPVTLNIDPAAIAAAVGPRTRAVVVVHYAGVACAMDEIASLTTANDLALIEDAAHGCGGSYAGRPLGSIGDFGTLSFHDTKNVQCGEGGALLVNRAEALPRAEVLREKGTNRRAFLRGDVDRYSWVDVGSSYLLGELPAAALLAQLEAADAVIGRRRTIWERYRVELSDWAQRHGVQLPAPPPYAEHAAQLFHLLLPTASARDEFLEHLRERDVGAAFHFVPLHLSPLARAFGHNAPLPVTESAAERLARLPLYPDLTDAQVGHVIDAVTSFRPAA